MNENQSLKEQARISPAGPTARKLFDDIMHYRDFDRMPVFHWGGWKETRRRWIEEGMNPDVPENVYFGVPAYVWPVGPNVGLLPLFEEKTLEETSTYRIFRQGNGSIVKYYKNQSSLPEHVGYTLKVDGQGWDDYQSRLQPCDERFALRYYQPGTGFRNQPIRPEPYPLPDTLEEFYQMSRTVDIPVCVSTGSIFGWLRDWMGVEQLAYITIDNPGLLTEMIETITDLVVWGLETLLPRVRADFAWGWEDISFRNGPLISPETMKTYGLPAYRRISETLRKHGIDLYLVDSDGRIDDLVPHWLDAGVNITFPVEIGVWHADPLALRRRFGKELRFYGAIDKSQLAFGRQEISAELQRRKPLMADGGYVPLTDHFVPPDVPLDNYRFYLDTLAEMRF